MEEKSSLNLEKRYRLLVFKGKSYTWKKAKGILGYALVVWLIVLSSFFLFTVVFLQPLFFFCFSSVPSLLIPFPVIYHGFCAIFIIHVWVRSWEFLCPISHLLKPSTISCKAAYLLFRHHLYINAARELAGQHLMRR